MPPRTQELSTLLGVQNVDGGWAYHRGTSWTEPTVYALLALSTARSDAGPALKRGIQWLEETRCPDGAWAPQPQVRQSSWVTALVVLFLARAELLRPDDPAINWLLRQSGKETSFLVRLRQTLLGVRAEYDTEYSGWPWFPGTSSWVPPTCLTILALGRVQAQFPNPEIQERLETGTKFVLSRMCGDGGWNQGSARALGYEDASYPETTGLALLALHGHRFLRRQEAIERALDHFLHCRSVQGRSWLKLGLLAHDVPLPEEPEDLDLPRWDTVETALSVIANEAIEGANVFLD